MSRCLRDKTILSLYEGNGTSEHRAHVESCAACAARYRRLEHDLEVIGQVLREPPPPGAFAYPPHSLRVRWAPIAVAFAMVIALVGGGIWMRGSPPPTVSLNEEVSPFLEEVSATLFSTAETDMAGIAAPVNLVESESPPAGEWPCEGPELFYEPGCLESPGWDQNSFSLPLEGE